MTDKIILAGAGGGGGKGGGGGSGTAKEDPNTLRSKAIGYAKDLWSQGQIFGYPDSAHPLRYTYLNEVPIENSDGTTNYTGFNFDYRVGIPTQTAMGSSGTETPLTVAGGEVLGGPDLAHAGIPGVSRPAARPWVGSITETETDAIRLIVSVPALTLLDAATGDLHGNYVDVRIEVRQTTGSDTSFHEIVHDSIAGKCVAAYERSYRINMPKPGPWEIRVSRDTADAYDSTQQKQLYVKGLVQIQDENYTYPYSAYAGISMDSEYFSGSIPKRQYLLKGMIVLIPSNYNPDTRLYSGVWDGTFTYGWTNNPAWIYYDLLVNPLRGLGNVISAAQVDKWALYQIAQYNDGWNARPWNASYGLNDYSFAGIHGVPNGAGGFEPRFTFNANINTQKDAYQVLQAVAASFRGYTYWGSGTISIIQDSPSDPVQVLAPSNVLNGIFNYASSRLTDRHTSCIVGYTNPDDFYKPDYVVAENPEAMQTYGYRDTSITALGCTSASQAYRLGKWLVQTEWDETETVTYSCGLDQLKCRPGQIVKIADPAIAGSRYGGRIVESTADTIGPYGQNLIPTPYIANMGVGSWEGRAPYGGQIDLRGGGITVTGRDGVEVGWRDTSDESTTSLESLYVAPISDDVPWRFALHLTTTRAFCNFATGSNIGNCTAGDVFYVSSWINTAGSTVSAFLGMSFYDASGNNISRVTGAGLGPNAGWTFESGTITAPAGAVSFKPAIYTSATDGTTNSPVRFNYMWIGRAAAYANNGMGLALTLDGPVSLEGGDAITLVRRDGTLMTANINFAYGSVTTIVLASALPEFQRLGAMWAIDGGVTKTTLWRVTRIREMKMHQFEVTAVQHDPTKYLRIEFDVRLPKASITRLSSGAINPPTNFAYVENLYRSNNQVRSRVTISWEATKDSNGNQDSRISGYHVDWMPPGATSWSSLMDTTTASFDLPDTSPGIYAFSIWTTTPFGRSTSPLIATGVNILGKSVPPGDVQNFTATPQLVGILLTWDAVILDSNGNLTIDILGYEVREASSGSGSWDSASPITQGLKATSLYVPVTDIDMHTYFIKAIGDSVVAGVTKYSLNAASVTSEIAPPDNVTTFSATPQGDNVLFNWVAVPGNDIQYEIRSGSTWIFGQTVWSGTGTSAVIVFPASGLVTFWIKSKSKAGQYSLVPYFAQCIMNATARNYILQDDVGAGGWSGVLNNTKYESITNTLAVQTNRIVSGKALNNAAWGVTGTATNNSTAAVDGTTTATKFVEPTGSSGIGLGFYQTQFFVAGKTYEFTASFKALSVGNKRWVSIILDTARFGNYLSAMLDTVTGAVVTDTPTLSNITSTSRGSGWWTLQGSAVCTSSGTGYVFIRCSSTSTDQYALNAGDGTSGVYIDNVKLRLPAELIYGEFFKLEEPVTGVTIRARNWLDSDFLMLDTNDLDWAGASFAWDSPQAASTSWIAAGQDAGGVANRYIATKQLSIPSNMVEAMALSSNLLSYLGAASVTSSSGASYAQHLTGNGLVLSSGGYVNWSVTIPSIFATRITVKLSSPAISENLFKLNDAGVAHSIVVTRNADGTFTMNCTDGNVTLPALSYTVDDFITFVIVQDAAVRTFAAYSQRTNDYQFVTSPHGSIGSLNTVSLAGSSALIPSIYANIEIMTTPYSGVALEDFATGGKSPVGYNDFEPFVVGDYQYQNAIIGVMMTAPPGNGRPAMDRFVLNVDVPNLNEGGTVACVSTGYTTVTLSKPWIRPPFIQGYVTSGTTISSIDTTSVSRTSFQIRLRDLSGTVIAGTVAYQCFGF